VAWYKRMEIPIAITTVFALYMIFEYFFNVPALKPVTSSLLVFVEIMGVFALGLGFISILMVHVPNIRKKRLYWPYSIPLLILMFFLTIIGLPTWAPTPPKEYGTSLWILGYLHPWFQFLYLNVIVPADATIFSLLAFFIASAAYRAFRARTKEAAALLLAGVLMLLKNAPLGTAIWMGFADIGTWLIGIPNMACMRGITIGIALGTIAIGIRTLIGRETGYFRGGG